MNEDIKAAGKGYRYTGKERDDESGFNYHGARYYAPWLGRWTAPDPVGLVDGGNLYFYARCNPIRLIDKYGTQADESHISNLNRAAIEEFWKQNPNFIWDEESQLYYYTDPNTYGTWTGREGQWVSYSPVEEIVIKPKPLETETRMFSHPAYEGFYQARAEANKRDWYDPAGIGYGVAANFAFVGGTIISFVDNIMALIGSVDPTGELQIALQQSTPPNFPLDDYAAFILRLGRSAYYRCVPSTSNAKLNLAIKRQPKVKPGNVSNNSGAIGEQAMRDIEGIKYVPEHQLPTIPETAGGRELVRRLDAPIIQEKTILGMTFPKEYIQVKNVARLKLGDLRQLVSTLRAAQNEGAVVGLYLRPSVRLHLELNWAPRSPVIRDLVDELRLNLNLGNVIPYSLYGY